MENASVSQERTARGGDKIARYNWIAKDTPGRLMMLPKASLAVDDSYQRETTPQKVLRMASEWSWISCGALIVAQRDDKLWIVDGQNRWAAAMKRSDISHMPCLVFPTASAREDALGFLGANTDRKPVSIFAKYKAMGVAGDPAVGRVQEGLRNANVELVQYASRGRQIKCAEWCLRYATSDFNAFVLVVGLAADLMANEPLNQKVLDGLMYLHRNLGDGLQNRKLVRRLRDVGGARIMDGIQRAATFYAKGGAKVYATGILSEINKGLRTKFAIDGE